MTSELELRSLDVLRRGYSECQKDNGSIYYERDWILQQIPEHGGILVIHGKASYFNLSGKSPESIPNGIEAKYSYYSNRRDGDTIQLPLHPDFLHIATNPSTENWMVIAKEIIDAGNQDSEPDTMHIVRPEFTASLLSSLPCAVMVVSTNKDVLVNVEQIENGLLFICIPPDGCAEIQIKNCGPECKVLITGGDIELFLVNFKGTVKTEGVRRCELKVESY